MEGFLNDMSDEDEEHLDYGGELLVIIISIIDLVLNSLFLAFWECHKIKTCWEIPVLESLAKDIKYNLPKLAIFFPESVGGKKSLF